MSIFVTRGDTAAFTVSVTESGELVPFQPGDTIYLTVKSTINSQEVLIQKVVTEFVEGKAYIEIEPADTKPLKFKDYVYDVQWTDYSGRVRTIIKPDVFTVGGEVTDD